MSLSFLFPITTSSRYVFYKSLLHKKFSKSSDLLYARVAQSALSVLNSGELDKTSDNSEESKIQQVINLLEIALQMEQDAEKDFLVKNFINNPIFSQYKKFHSEISAFCESKNFDYLQFIKLINQGLTGIENFNSDFIQKEIERIDILQTNIKKIFPKETKREKNERFRHYVQRGGNYSAASDRIDPDDPTKYLFPYEQLSKNLPKTHQGQLADKIQKTIQKFFNNYSSELIALCESKNLITEGTNDEQLIFNKIHKPLSIALTEILSFQSKTDLETVFNTFSTELDSRLKQFESALEVEGNTYRIHRGEDGQVLGTDLYNYINAACKNGDENIRKWIDDALTENASNIQSSLKDIDSFEKLQKYVNGKENKNSRNKRSSMSSRKGNASKILKQAIQLKEKSTKLKCEEKIKIITYEQLSDMKITVSRPKQAEITAAVNALIRTSGNNVYIEGSTNLKNDFVISFDIPINKILSNYQNSLLETIRQSEDEFRKGFRQLTSGYIIPEDILNPTKYTTTSVEASMMLKNITDDYIKKIKQAQLTATEVKEELQNIKNSLIVQGSVKDFYTFDNEFGFVGGTLGSDWHTALENLYKMYEQGGIDVADFKWLEFAILNCSPESLGAHLKNPIEKYLSFAAAMMMFNYGASQIAYAGEILKNKTESDSMKVFNLYYLNSIYYPGSLILQIILNRLKDCAQDLTGIKDKYSSGTGVQILNNSHYDIDTTRGKTKASANSTPEERWNIQAKNTDELISINFTFLAGLLDILDSLQEKLSSPI